MFRAFMRAPPSISGTDRQSTHQLTALLHLPPPLLNHIFDLLPVLDRCTLALTCRNLLHFAASNEHLDYLISAPPTIYHLEHFFQRLSRGWIDRSLLRYCPDCGKFASIDQHHWRYISEKHTRESVGRVSGIWRQRREDGWLRYWIERWCFQAEEGGGGGGGAAGGSSMAVAALKLVDTTELVCPRCAVVSPAVNEWRVGRIKERNERHAAAAAAAATGGESRAVGGGAGVRRVVVSPGINSPSVGGRMAAPVNGVAGEARVRSPLLERRQVAVATRGVASRAGPGSDDGDGRRSGQNPVVVRRTGLGIQTTTWL